MRDSLVDEEASKMRACELDVGASSSKLDNVLRSTTEIEGIVVVTTNSVPTTDGEGSRVSNSPSC